MISSRFINPNVFEVEFDNVTVFITSGMIFVYTGTWSELQSEIENDNYTDYLAFDTTDRDNYWTNSDFNYEINYALLELVSNQFD